MSITKKKDFFKNDFIVTPFKNNILKDRLKSLLSY